MADVAELDCLMPDDPLAGFPPVDVADVAELDCFALGREDLFDDPALGGIVLIQLKKAQVTPLGDSFAILVALRDEHHSQ